MAREMRTMDGNTAAAHVSYAFTDVAAIYPITPSSNMAEDVDKWSAEGRKNIFGQTVKVTEMQSEAGAAGAVHGSLVGGALTTTYTASQGLLLMIPNMYKMAGELLPSVIYVSARTIATHALSIFGDHADIYACRPTGYAMLACSSVQEVMDLSPISHLASLTGRVPFINFFDGFRTSHEVDKIEVWDYKDLEDMMDWDALDDFRKRSANPERPTQRGTAQNPDIFFQNREAANPYYNALPEIVEDYMGKINEKLGTDYAAFNYYGAEDAEHIIIAMGSVCQTIEETIDYLAGQGEKVGLVTVRLYRPFCADRLIAAIPDSVKSISVLDRTKEPGAIGEPLELDVNLALKGSKFENVPVYSGRYGLGSKDTIPADVIAVYRNAEKAAKPKFTLSITDDVTNLSLPREEFVDTSPEGTTSCKFWGLGADGTVGANHNSIMIIGDQTDMYAQAYFSYDSKKSGGVTISNLRFGKQPIKSTYLVRDADFVACHNPAYIQMYDMVSDLKKGGTFLLNCSWNDEEIENELPGVVKRYIAENDINFYVIDGVSIGREIGLGGRINTVLQSAFFKLANIIPIDDAIVYMKDAAKASYGRRGEEIVNMNYKAIEAGAEEVRKVEVPESWKTATGDILRKRAEGEFPDTVKFVDEILTPVNAQEGDKLPVSAFVGREDGKTPMGTAAYEKRGIAVDVPEWQPENCIQCTFCSYVCPHAVNRPVIMTEEEANNAPEGTKFVDAMGLPGYKFAMTFTVLDCTGCGSCANVCPGRKGEKALIMKPLESQLQEQEIFKYANELPVKEEVLEKFKVDTVKGSQFRKPLLEFSGACAGCGETPYAKLITQMFGERMIIANATGCSSIWGGSAPANPYTRAADGRGPAWANSLFEDNAEFGYGIYLAQKAIRTSLAEKLVKLAEEEASIKPLADEYIETYNNGDANDLVVEKLVAKLEEVDNQLATEILTDKEYLNKKSIWILGGDGWAYDIGFGGLDHVIASGEDINILVFDTEVYSNTGGQASKATPIGAVAQFAASGMRQKKKDLAGIAMTYGDVYVASVGMGANYNQTVKAFAEAESYNGPSLVIAYSPCINHGMRGGMTISQTQIKNAVDAGYWHLFRFDPRLTAEGKNPFSLDSKEPTMSYKDFLQTEVRYSSLTRSFPEQAEELFPKAAEVAKDRYNHLVRLSNLYEVDAE